MKTRTQKFFYTLGLHQYLIFTIVFLLISLTLIISASILFSQIDRVNCQFNNCTLVEHNCQYFPCFSVSAIYNATINEKIYTYQLDNVEKTPFDLANATCNDLSIQKSLTCYFKQSDISNTLTSTKEIYIVPSWLMIFGIVVLISAAPLIHEYHQNRKVFTVNKEYQ